MVRIFMFFVFALVPAFIVAQSSLPAFILLGQPQVLSSLVLNPNYVFGEGGTTLGTVNLSGPAPSGGTTVGLSTTSGVLDFPATVTVSEGASSVSFLIKAGHVSQTYVRYITASLNGVNRAAALTVHPGLVAAGVTPNSLTGGSPAQGVAVLAGLAPAGGVTVTIDDNSGSIITPPSLVVEGGIRDGYCSVSTTQVSADSVRLFFATLNGVTKAGYVMLTAGPRIASFSVTPSTVKGGEGANGLVTLTGPTPAGGQYVQITDNSSAINTFAEILISPGDSSGGFSIFTSPVSATYTRKVTVSMGGTARIANLTLTP